MTFDLHHGDCLEVMKDIPDGSVDLILTDIPYGEVNRKSSGLRSLDKGLADIVNFSIDDFLYECSRICKGSIYVFCGIEQISEIRKTLVANKFSTRACAWKKTNPSPMNGQHIWLSGIELCVYGKRAKATFNEHCQNTIWEYPTVRGVEHPTAKPLKLMERLVLASSNSGDVVLDPFMGSGTTGVACQNTNRNFIGIEMDQGYFDIAKTRIETAQPELQLAV